MYNRGGRGKRRKARGKRRKGASMLPGDVHQRTEEPMLLPREEYAAIFSIGGRRAPAPPPSSPAVRLTVSDRVGLGWEPEDSAAARPMPRDSALGTRLKLAQAVAGPGRELVIGLDFGTSSTKVVIADRAMNTAYAVPFMESVGLSSYLLPSALVESDGGVYALYGEGERHADLKLAMLARSDDLASCARVCAFLALVIRSARAWLFETKHEQYLRADILWTLALGQPADQAASASFQRHYEHMAEVAWYLAGKAGPIDVKSAEAAWVRREQVDVGDELEVCPMAEVSAQVHGFVSSSHFDVRQPNIYLLVDVGAGTVDATLFHVEKERDGTVSFSFFTHSVEPLGVANLNRHRLNWWLLQLGATRDTLVTSDADTASRIQTLMDGLGRLRLPTEYRGRYPEQYGSYVKGVGVSLEGGARSPDDDFHGQVRNQVAGRVLHAAWRQQLLTQDAVKDMPFFLCGGGARHSLYAALRTTLQKTPNCTWLRAKPRALTLPSNMVAPGVSSADFDRLSVAYGLSQLNPGAFERVVALKPAAAAEKENDWTISLVDKSVC